MLLIAAFAAGCGGGGPATLTSGDIATVGSQHISKTRFEAKLDQARASLKLQGQPFPKEGTTEYETLKAQAIWLLVQEAAREAQAAKLGIHVTAAAVNAKLAQLKKDTFAGSEAKYQQELKKEGLTDAEARNLIKERLISEQLTTTIAKDVTVSAEDVHAYYVANKAQYVPSREVLEILVGKKKKQLAQQLYEQLKNGADFAALAKKYSQDPGSKDLGGKFTAQKGRDVPDFDRVAFSIKTGELAPPVETKEYGWFVIKAVSPIKLSSEKDVAGSIREQLLGEKRNQAMTDWASDLAAEYCRGKKIAYQVGYTPNPDPCVQYTSTTATTP